MNHFPRQNKAIVAKYQGCWANGIISFNLQAGITAAFPITPLLGCDVLRLNFVESGRTNGKCVSCVETILSQNVAEFHCPPEWREIKL
ncbi:MAG TPA: hypothetical protein VGH42_14820 [Verrucomicrobiae bacterium]|jgi:hypothetical protein